MKTEEKIVGTKLGLFKLAKTLGNLSVACKIFGYSKESFYRFKTAYENGGDMGLFDVSRKKPNFKNEYQKN
jgi:hypothetical protein